MKIVETWTPKQPKMWHSKISSGYFSTPAMPCQLHVHWHISTVISLDYEYMLNRCCGLFYFSLTTSQNPKGQTLIYCLLSLSVSSANQWTDKGLKGKFNIHLFFSSNFTNIPHCLTEINLYNDKNDLMPTSKLKTEIMICSNFPAGPLSIMHMIIAHIQYVYKILKTSLRGLEDAFKRAWRSIEKILRQPSIGLGEVFKWSWRWSQHS